MSISPFLIFVLHSNNFTPALLYRSALWRLALFHSFLFNNVCQCCVCYNWCCRSSFLHRRQMVSLSCTHGWGPANGSQQCFFQRFCPQTLQILLSSLPSLNWLFKNPHLQTFWPKFKCIASYSLINTYLVTNLLFKRNTYITTVTIT